MNGSNDPSGSHHQARTTVLSESTSPALTAADLNGQPDDICFRGQKRAARFSDPSATSNPLPTNRLGHFAKIAAALVSECSLKSVPGVALSIYSDFVTRCLSSRYRPRAKRRMKPI